MSKCGCIYIYTVYAHSSDAPVSLIVPRRSGGYVISVDRQLLQYDWNTEETLTYAEVEKNTQNKFNDGKCDASGRLWAG